MPCLGPAPALFPLFRAPGAWPGVPLTGPAAVQRPPAPGCGTTQRPYRSGRLRTIAGSNNQLESLMSQLRRTGRVKTKAVRFVPQGNVPCWAPRGLTAPFLKKHAKKAPQIRGRGIAKNTCPASIPACSLLINSQQLGKLLEGSRCNMTDCRSCVLFCRLCPVLPARS